MNHSQQQTPGPVGFGFARNSSAQPLPAAQGNVLTENDLRMAAATIRSLTGSTAFSPLDVAEAHAQASRLSELADQASCGVLVVVKSAGDNSLADAAEARERARRMAKWEARWSGLVAAVAVLALVGISCLLVSAYWLLAGQEGIQSAMRDLAEAALTLAQSKE